MMTISTSGFGGSSGITNTSVNSSLAGNCNLPIGISSSVSHSTNVTAPGTKSSNENYSTFSDIDNGI